MSKKHPEFLIFYSREEWRDWLEINHNKSDGLWVALFKKKYADKGLTYNEAVEEALCLGWIDSQVLSLDNEKFIQRYTPRRKNSLWSVINKNRVEKMIAQGKMTEWGLIKIEQAKENGRWETAYSLKVKPTLPMELQKTFKQHPEFKKAFEKLSNAEQNRYLYWIIEAKRQETKEKRVSDLMDKLI